MNYAHGKKAFGPRGIQAAPGDVFSWYRLPPIGKHKYHLCLSFDYDFTFLNTPSDHAHRLDMKIAASHMRFLKPTTTNFSSVTCTHLQEVATVERFRSFKPVHLGTLASHVLCDLLDYIVGLRTTTPDDAERLSETIRHMRPIYASRRSHRCDCVQGYT